jgi:hypothetical protein
VGCSRFLLSVATASTVVGLLASAALGGGGTTIATAPPLPIGVNIVGGGTSDNCTGPCDYAYDYGEYYKVTAGASDQLVIDFGSTDGEDVSLCVLAPTVTDYTLEGDGCKALDISNGKAELRYVFPSAGAWTLNISGGCCNDQWAYQLTAYLKRYTHTTLKAPTLVKSGARVRIRGVVSGTTAGKIALEIKSPTSPKWKLLSMLSLSSKGAYVFATRFEGAGRYHLRALFAGNSGHRPSSASHRFTVVWAAG